MLTCREYTPYISAYFAEYQLYWKAADHLGGGGGGGEFDPPAPTPTPPPPVHPLHPPPRSAPAWPGTQVTLVLTMIKFIHSHNLQVVF